MAKLLRIWLIRDLLVVPVEESIVFVEFHAICVNKIQERGKDPMKAQDSLKGLLCDAESTPGRLLLHQAR